MNKQLLLGEIELDIYEWSNDRAETAVGSIEEKYCDYHLKLLDKYKKLVNQLDEPKKVIVPKYVAEWIEEHCYMGKYVCLETFMCQYNDVDLPTKLYNYYDNNRDNARDKVISAILNGYEVDKEQLWTVQINEKYLAGMQIYNESETGNIDNKEAYHITTVSRLQNAKKFNMLEKAEAVALIAGGIAVKVED